MLEVEVYIQPWRRLLPGTEGIWGPHKAAAPHLPGPSPRASPPPPSPLQAPHARLLLFVKRKPSGARTAVAGGPGPAAVLAGATGTPASSPHGVPLQDCGAPALLWGPPRSQAISGLALSRRRPPGIAGVSRGAQSWALRTSSPETLLAPCLLPGTTRLPLRPLRGHRKWILGTCPAPGELCLLSPTVLPPLMPVLFSAHPSPIKEPGT